MGLWRNAWVVDQIKYGNLGSPGIVKFTSIGKRWKDLR